MATTRTVTAEDLFLMGDEADRQELVQGELRPMSPGGGRHEETGVRLIIRLGSHVLDNNLGEVYGPDTGSLIARDPDTVLSPDVSFISAERLPPPEERVGFLLLPPDLAVEILPPSERPGAVAWKVGMYRAAAVRLIWILDPRTRAVTAIDAAGNVRVYQEDDELDGGDVLPGFRVHVGDLFG